MSHFLGGHRPNVRTVVLHHVRAPCHRTILVVHVDGESGPTATLGSAPIASDAAAGAAAAVEARGRPRGAAGFLRPPGDLQEVPGGIEKPSCSILEVAQRMRKADFKAMVRLNSTPASSRNAAVVREMLLLPPLLRKEYSEEISLPLSDSTELWFAEQMTEKQGLRSSDTPNHGLAP